MTEAYIIDAARTPRGIGKLGKGSLSEFHPKAPRYCLGGNTKKKRPRDPGYRRRRDRGAVLKLVSKAPVWDEWPPSTRDGTPPRPPSH